MYRILEYSLNKLPLIVNKSTLRHSFYEDVFNVFGHRLCNGNLKGYSHICACIYEDYIINSSYHWVNRPKLCMGNNPSYRYFSHSFISQIRKNEMNNACKALQASQMIRDINEMWSLHTGLALNIPKKGNGSNLYIGSLHIQTIGLHKMVMSNYRYGVRVELSYYSTESIAIDDIHKQIVVNNCLRFDYLT